MTTKHTATINLLDKPNCTVEFDYFWGVPFNHYEPYEEPCVNILDIKDADMQDVIGQKYYGFAVYVLASVMEKEGMRDTDIIKVEQC